jgi:rRNA maturation endonuclease Nob1
MRYAMINENNSKDITCKKCNTSFDAPEKNNCPVCGKISGTKKDVTVKVTSLEPVFGQMLR